MALSMHDFTEVTIDHIHHLIEQSRHLQKSGYHTEALVLQAEAEQHAKELRDQVHCHA
tara:strand:+ start:3382 stop:3555 length:174 start_codon:yes stop_codon:yes gene_type:complete